VFVATSRASPHHELHRITGSATSRDPPCHSSTASRAPLHLRLHRVTGPPHHGLTVVKVHRPAGQRLPSHVHLSLLISMSILSHSTCLFLFKTISYLRPPSHPLISPSPHLSAPSHPLISSSPVSSHYTSTD